LWRRISKEHRTSIYFIVFYQGTISCVAGTAKLVVLPNLTSCQKKPEEEKEGMNEDKYNGN
jgi:hypothetical protein